MKTEEVRQHLKMMTPNYCALRRDVVFTPDPYQKKNSGAENIKGLPPIFLTGRFRSGSTLLWNIFRNLPYCTAYYEPFNERRWFSLEGRGDNIDSTHRGVSEYWSEYVGLESLGEYYREDWTRRKLYMDELTFDPEMKSYIQGIVEGSRGRAVLQFNRVDFRLPWLKANFPDSPIVHIFRNPRDQWCSTLRDIKSYPAESNTADGFIDRFYLQVWVRDLCQQFPFLHQYRHAHQYYNFYFLWRLSHNFGRQYADISLSMEELTADPAGKTREILDVARWSAGAELPDLSFVRSSATEWQEYASAEWFDAIEDECNVILKDFLK
jgi:hypothetical protein